MIHLNQKKDPQSAALDALKDVQDAMKLATMKFTLCLVFPEKICSVRFIDDAGMQNETKWLFLE